MIDNMGILKSYSKRRVIVAGIVGIVIGVLLGAGGMVAISGQSSPSSSDGPKAAEKPTPTGVKTDSSGPAVANIGKSALRVGGTRHGTAIDTTVLQVKDDYRAGNFRPAEGNTRWLGVEARTCVKGNLKEQNLVSWGDFEAGNKDGETFPASGTSWSDFPSPQYPTATDLQQGCRQGWLLIPIPKGSKVDRIRLGSVAEWLF